MKNDVLCSIPDTVTLTRDYFQRVLRLNPLARRFGFSVKHTKEIIELRQKAAGSTQHKLPEGLYGLPVTWNVPETYVAR